MIYPQTIVTVADNSGARKILSIKTLRSKVQNKLAVIGNLIVGVVKRINKRKKLKKGSIFNCLVVRHKNCFRLHDGQSNNFSTSAVILLNRSKNPIANRIFGPLPGIIREVGFSRILLMCQGIFE